ncbi:MAG: acyltransferase [Carboxylicivirga sp.]|jgi:peptidoglycan/LPS O-acetylase OafA/YrhL|nr:acyltransferase [Carboxylicivirga sp.]
METQNINSRQRLYYIDWLRIILILTVFLFHVGMVFNSWDWHIKNDQTFPDRSALWYIMVYLGQWRMPLLILVSGAGTYLALGKRTGLQYLLERCKRLLIPLVAGIFILVPIQVYLERADQFSSLWDYYPHMFEGVYPVGNFSWHHLWFIAYLFFIALIISSFHSVLISRRFSNFIKRLTPMICQKLGLNYLVVPIILSQLFLRPYFPDNTHDFINDWAAIAYYFLYFLLGYIIVSKKQIMESIQKNRRYYLLQSVIATLFMFTIPSLIESDAIATLVWRISSYLMAWACGLSALGYARKYLNFDSKYRKIANEAIYPFYLIHQPIIVLMAFYVVGLNISLIWKVILITTSSFTLTVLIYLYVVRPFDFMRILFGMKPIIKANVQIKESNEEQLKVCTDRVSAS